MFDFNFVFLYLFIVVLFWVEYLFDVVLYVGVDFSDVLVWLGVSEVELEFFCVRVFLKVENRFFELVLEGSGDFLFGLYMGECIWLCFMGELGYVSMFSVILCDVIELMILFMWVIMEFVDLWFEWYGFELWLILDILFEDLFILFYWVDVFYVGVVVFGCWILGVEFNFVVVYFCYFEYGD